jgi:hypothetical protein
MVVLREEGIQQQRVLMVEVLFLVEVEEVLVKALYLMSPL